jgi:hypothetical protein
MKNLMFAFSVATVIVCGFVILRKNHELELARASAADQRRSLTSEDAGRDERQLRQLQAQLQAARAAVVEGAPQVEVRAPSETNAPGTRLFANPRMRKALEDEAQIGIHRNVARLFKAGLADQLHLDANQSQALQDLMTQKGNILWTNFLLPLMTGQIQQADMAALGQALLQAYQDNQAQIQALIGDDGLKTSQWYEQTQSARDAFNKIDTALANIGAGLTPEQASQLLALMEGEQASLQLPFTLDDPSKMDLNNWYNNFSEDKLEALIQAMEQMNQRIIQRAQSVLSPEQATAMNELLAEQALKGELVMRNTTAIMASNR